MTGKMNGEFRVKVDRVKVDRIIVLEEPEGEESNGSHDIISRRSEAAAPLGALVVRRGAWRSGRPPRLAARAALDHRSSGDAAIAGQPGQPGDGSGSRPV